ncbi:MAG: YczE/YyaS/YitT family protein [Micromonosporaceae bacterium]
MAYLVKHYGSLAGRRLPWRLTQLYIGLVLYGVSMALLVESTLGLDPWDVLHQGLAIHTGLRFGWIVIIASVLVLLAWIPLRQKPGFGTLSNALVIGLVVDAALAVIPTVEPLWLRWVFLLSGVLLNGLATGLYIGARLGPGPRDGLMTGLAARGHSIRVVRTAIEASVLVVGFLLGGTVGIGTLLYAVAIGPLAHVFIPLFTVPEPAQPEPAQPEPDGPEPLVTGPRASDLHASRPGGDDRMGRTPAVAVPVTCPADGAV